MRNSILWVALGVSAYLAQGFCEIQDMVVQEIDDETGEPIPHHGTGIPAQHDPFSSTDSSGATLTREDASRVPPRAERRRERVGRVQYRPRPLSFAPPARTTETRDFIGRDLDDPWATADPAPSHRPSGIYHEPRPTAFLPHHDPAWATLANLDRQVARMQRRFDDVLAHLDRPFSDRAFAPFRRSASAVGPRWTPSVDIAERDDAYVFHAELPGMRKEDVEVSLRGNVLTVAGKRSSRHEDRDVFGRVHRVESSAGSFRRTFRLPRDASAGDVEGTFTDGVLQVVVAKKAPTVVRKIPIA